jgi:hypothetical protein
MNKRASMMMVLGIFCAVAACASGGASTSGGRVSPNRITRDEVAASNASNAYELISRLRPNWLREPATASVSGGVIRSQTILLYVNRQRQDDLDALKSISVDAIDSAEWVDASRVQTVLSDVPSGSYTGAIMIKTR